MTSLFQESKPKIKIFLSPPIKTICSLLFKDPGYRKISGKKKIDSFIIISIINPYNSPYLYMYQSIMLQDGDPQHREYQQGKDKIKEKLFLFKLMPNRARRTKGWCKPMATGVLSIPEEKTEPPVKNLCERSGFQRKPQLHSRSQEQILHLILAKRPRRYDCPSPDLLQIVATPHHSYGSRSKSLPLQLIFKRERDRLGDLFHLISYKLISLQFYVANLTHSLQIHSFLIYFRTTESSSCMNTFLRSAHLSHLDIPIDRAKIALSFLVQWVDFGEVPRRRVLHMNGQAVRRCLIKM